jgi:CDP-diacylglycerol--serine O-phosphatidyltransferase
VKFLFNAHSQFNIANLVTFANITTGLLALYFITQHDFFTAIILAWMGGAFDIMDGKLARKYDLSTEFGVQVDSFADFVSFVLVPPFLLFEAIFSTGFLPTWIVAIIIVYYILAGLRRLITFNINTDAGSVDKFFTGVPTPLGAILLWVVYLLFSYDVVTNGWVLLGLIALIGALLNSKVKIPHP